MKHLTFIPLVFFLCFLPVRNWAQCQEVALVDSSFEFSVFHGYSGTPETGKWFYDDGVIISSDAFTGNQSACSNGGGGFQFVRVDTHTTYFVSAYILNGANETAPYPHFRINWIPHPVSVSSNDWTFISTSFDSGSDSMAIIGFYSLGACFDEVRITCSPLTSLDLLLEAPKPYSLMLNFSDNQFHLSTDKELTIEVRAVTGQLLEHVPGSSQAHFGSGLSRGVYLLIIQTEFGSWVEKLIKF